MNNNMFHKVAAFEGNEKWDNYIKRQKEIYVRENDIRNDFTRDYNRILHSTAYRRLKHKTQVFFATGNDHICTRIEHVNHVVSVSYTISKYLGLNTELTNAIAIGHDLGHAPFGHHGEKILNQILVYELGDNSKFWHEKNSLRFVDLLETLVSPDGKITNLNLTYAVRDGIISHCGEVNENSIFPRDIYLDLKEIEKPNQYLPYTWEGCIVKVADKISYLGRDIEDAITLNILPDNNIKKLLIMIKKKIKDIDIKQINNTVLMHNFIIDLCSSSSPEKGICFSEKYLELINAVKDFNYENIYNNSRLSIFKNYASLIINSIYEILIKLYTDNDLIRELKEYEKIYPLLIGSFLEWLLKYSNIRIKDENKIKHDNEILYNLYNRNDYVMAIVDFISGMTDTFAIKVFNQLIQL